MLNIFPPFLIPDTVKEPKCYQLCDNRSKSVMIFSDDVFHKSGH